MPEFRAPPLTRDFKHFDPAAYLREYYGDVGAENLALLRFMSETYRGLPRGGRLLDFGGGPTIYPLISAVGRVDEVHFSDYLPANLEEVRRWLSKHPAAFDWRDFVRQAIELETEAPCTEAEVTEREDRIRGLVTQVMRCDASRTPPIDGAIRPYEVVVTNFCAESATSDRHQWRAFVVNIVSLLKPGGVLIMSALKGAGSYAVGSRRFPAVDISEDDLIELLEETGFRNKKIELRSVPADRPSRDYDGLIMAVARKENAAGSGAP
jgi:hypothetical protein